MSMEEIKEQDNTSIFTASFTVIELVVTISNAEIIDYDCDRRLVWVVYDAYNIYWIKFRFTAISNFSELISADNWLPVPF